MKQRYFDARTGMERFDGDDPMADKKVSGVDKPWRSKTLKQKSPEQVTDNYKTVGKENDKHSAPTPMAPETKRSGEHEHVNDRTLYQPMEEISGTPHQDGGRTSMPPIQAGGTVNKGPLPPAPSSSPGAGGATEKPPMPIGQTQHGSGVANPPPLPPTAFGGAPGPMPPQQFDAKVRVQRPQSTKRVEMFGGKDSKGPQSFEQAESHPTGNEFPTPRPAGAVQSARGAARMQHFDRGEEHEDEQYDAVVPNMGSEGSYSQQSGRYDAHEMACQQETSEVGGTGSEMPKGHFDARTSFPHHKTSGSRINHQSKQTGKKRNSAGVTGSSPQVNQGRIQEQTETQEDPAVQSLGQATGAGQQQFDAKRRKGKG